MRQADDRGIVSPPRTSNEVDMKLPDSFALRPLGSSGIEVSPICLGGNVFGWTIGETASFAVLDAFLNVGLNFIDTADVYSKWAPGNQGGESETIIGKWLKRTGARQRVVVATKVGMELAPDKKGLSKSYILRAAEASLTRLQTDYIDLYQSHSDDAATPLEETLEAYAELIRQGKVRAIGASNYTGPRLREALGVSQSHHLPRYQSLQPHYNLYERQGYETDLEPVAKESGIGVIPYFSLASGFLTGKYRSEADLGKSARGQGLKKYLDPRGIGILNALDEVASLHSTTAAAVALAWLMARPSIAAPIASATNPEQLQQLVAAIGLKLDVRSIELLNEASRY
jgi:aryl-alcohol dehydrogenase-like predicted oxidoreductase